MGLYRELAHRREAGAFDASGLRVFQLDEYAGIDPCDPRSLLSWAIRSFVWPLGIPMDNLITLPTHGEDLAESCAAYDRAMEEAGGYDLAILGIGTNGHLGFNEPPAHATSPTREVALSPDSIASSAPNWGGPGNVPRRAVTIGMAGLLSSRKILLLASGSHKREIVSRALRGPVTPTLPASYLQDAADVTVLLDREAWDGT
jgi:glucosamine-6-phosphate deaminase